MVLYILISQTLLEFKIFFNPNKNKILILNLYKNMNDLDYFAFDKIVEK